MTELQTRAFEAFTKLKGVGFDVKVEFSSDGGRQCVWMFFDSNHPLKKHWAEQYEYNNIELANRSDEKIDEYLKGAENGN